MKLFMLLVCVAFLPLLANPPESFNFRIQQEVVLREAAETQTQTLVDNITSYLEFWQKTNLESEKHLKEIGEWDQACQRLEAFKKSFFDTHAKFIEFRQSLAECIAISDDYSPHACISQASSIASFTDWYFNHITTMILPSHWNVETKKLE